MKILKRVVHEAETLFSWLESETYIDGHTWMIKSVKKIGDKYFLIEECECGKQSDKTWMDEMTYLRTKDQYPPLSPTPDKSLEVNKGGL